MRTITAKIVEMFITPDYDRNYERAAYAEHTCICCGRKLNPKTMKYQQAIEPGYFIDCEEDLGCHYESKDGYRQVSMGFYEVGPKCYKEIRRRLAESTETMEVRL